MKHPFTLWACTLLAALLTAGGALAQTPCADKDQDCARRALQQHPVRQLAHWQAASTASTTSAATTPPTTPAAPLARPVADRIAIAPAPLLDYLRLDNIAHAYPERPHAAQPDAAFLADLRAALAELPPAVLRLVDKKLIGLYLVEDLGGSGYTDVALDSRGQPVAGFVVLDAGVLARRSANDWATWKEGTPFKPQPGYALRAQIETGRDDNRKHAIQYILLHELGHVLSIGADFHPTWTVPPASLPLSARYPFYDLSWQMDRDSARHSSLFDGRFQQRPRVAYYFGAKLDASDMLATYSRLAETNFPTLYAATNPFDDFAESFASYVHTVLMRRPWQVTLLQGGKPVFELGPCWAQARCAAKRALLERALSGG